MKKNPNEPSSAPVEKEAIENEGLQFILNSADLIKCDPDTMLLRCYIAGRNKGYDTAKEENARLRSLIYDLTPLAERMAKILGDYAIEHYKPLIEQAKREQFKNDNNL